MEVNVNIQHSLKILLDKLKPFVTYDKFIASNYFWCALCMYNCLSSLHVSDQFLSFLDVLVALHCCGIT